MRVLRRYKVYDDADAAYNEGYEAGYEEGEGEGYYAGERDGYVQAIDDVLAIVDGVIDSDLVLEIQYLYR